MKERIVQSSAFIRGEGGVEEGSDDDSLPTRGNHMTFPPPRHHSFSHQPRHDIGQVPVRNVIIARIRLCYHKGLSLSS